MLEQKNKILSTETTLQRGRYQNLVLLLTLGLVTLVILGGWLAKVLKRSNFIRQSAQMDGLTQVSNRAHITACSQLAFSDAHSTVSLILFDMDLFKRINDSNGHPTGDWLLKTVCETVKAQLRRACRLQAKKKRWPSLSVAARSVNVEVTFEEALAAA